MSARSMPPQHIQSVQPSLFDAFVRPFFKPLLLALALTVAATVVFGSLWARADGGEARQRTADVASR